MIIKKQEIDDRSWFSWLSKPMRIVNTIPMNYPFIVAILEGWTTRSPWNSLVPAPEETLFGRKLYANTAEGNYAYSEIKTVS